MSNLSPAIKVRNLAFFYGKKKALQGVGMDIYQNQVTALIGPSGCGKSTFIKSLNRISELETEVRVEGLVEFFGQNIYDSKVNLNKLRAQMGMVFQKPNLFPMSIYENVAYGLRIAGAPPKAKLDEIIEKAIKGAALWDEVKDRLNTSALGLSGGQQQRLCIARALAVEPKVLLMDEPCSALDPKSTLKVEELIHSLKDKVTIVIVTHNMQQATRVSDFTGFFYVEGGIGQLVEFGHTDQIFQNPIDQRTNDYVTGKFS